MGLPTLSGIIAFCGLVLAVQCKMDFVFKNCGATDFIELKSRKVSPYPIPIPGKITVNGEVEVKQWPKEAQYVLDVSIQSKVTFIWVPVPCISDVGSCTYDLCSLVSEITNKTGGCPQQLKDNNVPCTCETMIPGTYSLHDAKFNIPELSGLWSWLATGDYKVTFHLKDKATRKDRGCLHGELTLVDPTSCSGFLCSIFG